MTPGLNSAHWCIRCADAASIGPCLHLSFLPLRGLILRAPITYSSAYSTPPTHTPTHHVQQHSSIHAQFVAVSCWDFHAFIFPRHNGDQASPSREHISTPPARRCRLLCVSNCNFSHCCCAIYHSQAEFLVVSPPLSPVSSPRTLQWWPNGRGYQVPGLGR